MDVVAVYASAARGFTDLVRRIPAEAFAGPGLGDWDLRALVGHTSRSLTTVITYLDAPAERVDIDGPVAYYQMAAEFAADEGAAGVLERGRRAGVELGADPGTAVDALAAEALAKLAGRGDDLISVLGGAGMRLSGYLPTRVFELTVHGFDIADATGLPFSPPDDALLLATSLSTGIAVATGHAEVVLRALTGRAGLPTGFSVTV
ncbi:mycothiol maleylpyruvate isomerase [Mycobacterium sp. MS1601]|uniref:maleylpyruvate isomerase N-terminal domain-containing protein n=1 Tax=Mycobacterium sp. MS1601 TaxID=1936029 RepID=UPI0009793E55|nr:maleylpyruvate isomerase N-terminal domain-containing protein [Mycobacterium sp. MS1601]AQA04505.1 mycothiol maleylpyruvate isomerase [Mycobacterium sp. MS1601]